MKKSMALLLVTMLALGICSVALADGNNSPKMQDRNKTVDLIVKVAQWATISTPEAMELELTQPGNYASAYQDITIRTNTNVTVRVSQPELRGENSTALSAAIEAGAFSWGLGFQGDDSDDLYPGNSFEINAGNENTRQLIFWAEWRNDNWWQLPADDYEGTATITVSAR